MHKMQYKGNNISLNESDSMFCLYVWKSLHYGIKTVTVSHFLKKNLIYQVEMSLFNKKIKDVWSPST